MYVYSSSKTALNMVGKALSNEFSPEGFKVTVVHPGWFQTDMGEPNAETPVIEAAAGIIEVLDTTEVSGQFKNFDPPY